MYRPASLLKAHKMLPIAAICASLLNPCSANAAVSILKTSLDDDKWLSPYDAVSISVQREADYNEANLRFFLGKDDLTALFVQPRPGYYVYQPSVIPLPVGSSELIIYQQEGEQWQEITRLPLKVKDRLGFQQSEIKPSLSVNFLSELNNGYHGDAIAPERQKETDMTANIGLSANAQNDDFSVDAAMNLVGASRREEALRFSEKGTAADKVDLSDYIIQFKKGDQDMALGHINYGQNRYLLNGFGSRGLRYQGYFGDAKSLDFSFASMSATSIVGFNNVTGLSRSQHRISAASLGYEILASRPGGLRAELSYMDASALPLTNFDEGGIADAETSRGLGLKLTGSNEKGDLRGELTWASSTYHNPQDPFLALGDTLVDVPEQTDQARHVEIAYDIFQTEANAQGDRYSVSVSLSHERIDPLYKSIGGFVSADTQTNILSLSSQLEKLNVQLSHSENEDNVDNIATVLKTKTDSTNLSLSVPFKQIYSSAEYENKWLPDVQLSLGRVHQYGANKPVTFDENTHIPDQMNTSQAVNLSWSADKLTFTYGYSISEQDNRQPGRENADFENRNHNINLNYIFSETLTGSLGLSKVKAIDVENQLITYDDNISLGVNWQISSTLSLNTSYSEFDGEDNKLDNLRDGYSGQSTLNWQFEIPLMGKKLPGQFFLTYTNQQNRSVNNTFNINSEGRSWILNSGLNISLF